MSIMWVNELASLSQVDAMLKSSIYSCQPSPDGTLLVWNRQTADSVSRVHPGQWLWLSKGVLFVANEPVEEDPVESWLQGIRGEVQLAPISQEESFYKVRTAAELLTASIQNPAPCDVLVRQWLYALENMRKVLAEVSESIPYWENKDDNTDR